MFKIPLWLLVGHKTRDKLQSRSVVLLHVGVALTLGGGGVADDAQKGLESPSLSFLQGFFPGKWTLGVGAPGSARLILSGEPRKTRKAWDGQGLACSVPGPALRPLPPPCSGTELYSLQSTCIFHPHCQPALWNGQGRCCHPVLWARRPEVLA